MCRQRAAFYCSCNTTHTHNNSISAAATVATGRFHKSDLREGRVCTFITSAGHTPPYVFHQYNKRLTWRIKCCTLAPFFPLRARSCTCSDDSSVCLTQFPQCPQCTRRLIRYKQLSSYRGTTSRSSNEWERLRCWHSNTSALGTRKRLSDLMTEESATWPVNFPVNYKATVVFCPSSPAPGRHGKDLNPLRRYISDMIPAWADLKTAVIYCEKLLDE